MALTNLQALEVVSGCVRGVSGQIVTPDRTLRAGGIVDSGRLGAFKSLVVSDASRGVGQHDHRIDSSALSGVAIDDTVQATADVVRANAVPIAAGVLLEEVVVVSVERVALSPEPGPQRVARARKKRKATRKTAKKRASRKEAIKEKASGKRATRTTGKKRASKRKGGSPSRRARKSRKR